MLLSHVPAPPAAALVRHVVPTLPFAAARAAPAEVVSGHYHQDIRAAAGMKNGPPVPTATVTVTMTPGSSPPPPPPPPMRPPQPSPNSMGHDEAAEAEGECRLLGPFAILVQLALGGLALLSLVYKRWRERPQRPVKIWFFDVSKQVFGSVLVHIVNVFMSMLTSGRFSIKVDPATVGQAARRLVTLVLLRRDEGYRPNPCSFYLLNLAIDTTVGIPILIGLLHLTTRLVASTPWGKPAESIESGNYGNPPRAYWWLKQSIIYFCGLLGMKICVLVLFMVLPWISRVGDWALGWTEGNERLQIIFVMMLFPLIMNAVQYYIIDSFIKKKEDGGHHHHAVAGEYDELNAEEDLEVEDEVDRPHQVSGRRMNGAAAGPADDDQDDQDDPGVYDPAVDGHISEPQQQGVTRSSSSDHGHKEGDIPKELYPPE